MNHSRRLRTALQLKLQFSLRVLLLVAFAANLAGAWFSHHSQQQSRAIAAIEKLGGSVTTEPRDSAYVLRLCGRQFRETAIAADVPMNHTAAAIPHLQALPDLQQVDLNAPPESGWTTDRADAAEAAIAQALPQVRVRSLVPLFTIVTPRIIIIEEPEEVLGFPIEE